MAFPDHFLDDIRQRVGLVDLIGRTVKLKKQGQNWIGLCPFHQEKTPSFSVNEDKGFYHCFGCGSHGSAFDFVMNTEGLQFHEAVVRLAGVAGLALPEQDDPGAAAAREKRASLFPLLEAAASWFQSTLSGASGAAARSYLARRGIRSETAAEFRLGYAPDSGHDLRQAMLARGFTMAQLDDTGLVTTPEDGSAPYNRFRNRLMFPITDLQNRVVAFGGRALGQQRAKYLNSPETAVFQKGRLLYNAAPARAAAQRRNRLLVVEGYMDVIALHQAGFPEAVAPLGTAVTENQLSLLWRIHPEPILCFDGDEAGQRAAARAAERALPLLQAGKSLYFLSLPAGEDPDSMIAKEGASAFATRLEAAEPMAAQLWTVMTAEGQYNTPERLAGLRQNMAAVARQIKDETIADYYKLYFRDRFDATFTPGRRHTAGGQTAYRHPNMRRKSSQFYASQGRWRQNNDWQIPVPPLSGAKTLGQGDEGSSQQREMVLVAAFLLHPALVEEFSDELAHLPIAHPGLDRVRGAILQQASTNAPLDAEAVRSHLSDSAAIVVFDDLVGRRLEKLAPFIRRDTAYEETKRGWIGAYRLHLLREMRHDLRQAEEAFAEHPTEANQTRLLACKSALDAYERETVAIDSHFSA